MSMAPTSGGDGARRDEALPASVNDGVETLKRTSAEQLQVARLSEDNLVNGFKLPATQDRIPDVARDILTVGHYERLILLLHGHACLLQCLRGDPGDFRTRVDHKAPHIYERRATRWFGDLNVYREDSHRPA